MGPDLFAGAEVNFWMLLREAPKRGKNPYWLCRCVCGHEREVQANSLRYSGAASCGCQTKAILREHFVTHGMTGTAGYRSWQSMRQRCENPNDTAFKDYGERGIRVCDRWQTFENFWADMGATHGPKMTLERRDVNRGYEPDNCCWIAKTQQPKNRRCVPVIDGPWGKMLLPELAAKVGLSVVQMQVRYRKGWRGEKLWSAPTEKGARVTPHFKA